jgi:dihydroorotate dehydrogenase electron transfer subunit
VKRARAEILSTRRLGGYHALTLVAPEIAERARPGQFVSVGMPHEREFLLRRHFSIHQSSRRGGWAGTLEFAFEVAGPGTTWLSQARAHRFLDVIGPLGRPFSFPKRLTNCLLVAEGHGAASLYFLAQELLARQKRVDMIVGGLTLENVFKPIEAKRLSQTVKIMTVDGSLGDRGTVGDALAEAADRSRAEVVYAAASPRMLRRIADFCASRRLPAQIAVEERMGCGTGLCYSCVVPLGHPTDGGHDLVRACVDGPVFDPTRIIWDRWQTEMLPAMPAGTSAARGAHGDEVGSGP